MSLMWLGKSSCDVCPVLSNEYGNWTFMLSQVAVTDPVGPATISGVPLGRLLPTPVEITRGWPFEVTRVVPVAHIAATHGGSGGGTNGHPATTHCAFKSTVGVPLSVTLGFGDVAMACPPWLHITVAPSGNKYPPIAWPPVT
jgi:hypothetical protein